MYVQPKMVKCQFFFRFFPQQQFNRQFSFRVEVLNPMGWYLGHKGLLAPPPPSQCAHVACFCTFFKIFHVRLGKKTKTVSFYSGVCMCKGKTNTCQVFFSIIFFCTFPLEEIVIPQKSGEMKKVCTFCVSSLGSFQDQISSSLEENPQNTPRCPENVKNTAKHPAWMDIIDIMCFTHSSNHLNTCLALTIHRNLSRGPG